MRSDELVPTVDPVPAGSLRPFWSVVVPSYEAPELLTGALESVLEQAPPPHEMQIHVVDDCSRHDIESVVRRVGAGRVTFSRNETNVGPPVNFTNCARAATGHWVHILHQDDRVLPGFYDRYRAVIEAQACALVIGGSIVVDGSGRELMVTPPFATSGGAVENAQQALATLHPVHCSAIVVARATYERVGGFRPDLVYAADREMWARLAAAGAVGYVDTPHVRCLYHAASDSSRLQGSIDYVRDITRAIDIMSEGFPDDATRRCVRREGRASLAGHVGSVGRVHAAAGRVTQAMLNAAWSVRLDPSLSSVRRSLMLAGAAARNKIAGPRDGSGEDLPAV